MLKCGIVSKNSRPRNPGLPGANLVAVCQKQETKSNDVAVVTGYRVQE